MNNLLHLYTSATLFKLLKPLTTPLLIQKLLIVLLSLSVIGCVSTNHEPFVIDDISYRASGKSQRIKFIILHYTAETESESLRLLTEGNVSAHYLIPETDNDIIFQLVPDNERAWHAGNGSFAGRSILNDTSIGIEIVNEGIKETFRTSRNKDNNGYHPSTHYVAFKQAQIEKLAYLINDLAAKYDIDPTYIIGHSDMAPSRKIDPGAKFPWYLLYKEHGIGAWYDEWDKQNFMDAVAFHSATVQEIKSLLRAYGYEINNTSEWDKQSRDVVYAFQLHFRPQNPTGIMDLETYAILMALNKKYSSE